MYICRCRRQVCWQIPHLHGTVLAARRYKWSFHPEKKHKDQGSLMSNTFTKLYKEVLTCVCRWGGGYLEHVIDPTALVWLEPCATHRTWPLSLSMCHTRTDLSYKQMATDKCYYAHEWIIQTQTYCFFPFLFPRERSPSHSLQRERLSWTHLMTGPYLWKQKVESSR